MSDHQDIQRLQGRIAQLEAEINNLRNQQLCDWLQQEEATLKKRLETMIRDLAKNTSREDRIYLGTSSYVPITLLKSSHAFGSILRIAASFDAQISVQAYSYPPDSTPGHENGHTCVIIDINRRTVPGCTI
jgi:hypothetical protein